MGVIDRLFSCQLFCAWSEGQTLCWSSEAREFAPILREKCRWQSTGHRGATAEFGFVSHFTIIPHLGFQIKEQNGQMYIGFLCKRSGWVLLVDCRWAHHSSGSWPGNTRSTLPICLSRTKIHFWSLYVLCQWHYQNVTLGWACNLCIKGGQGEERRGGAAIHSWLSVYSQQDNAHFLTSLPACGADTRLPTCSYAPVFFCKILCMLECGLFKGISLEIVLINVWSFNWI